MIVHQNIAELSSRPLGWPLLLCLQLVGLPGGQLLAAEQQEPPGRPDALVSPESMIQMFIALLVVVALIVGLSIVVRRLSLIPGASSGVVRIVGGLALNNKDRLLLIQVGDEQILISASPGRIGKIHDLHEPIDPTRYGQSAGPDGKSFNNLLSQMLNKSK